MLSPHLQMPAIAESISGILEGVTAGDRAMLLGIGLFFTAMVLVVTVASVVRLISLIHKRRLEASLKQDMLDFVDG
ncbi:MAG: hypothetical protein AAFY88_23715, partial [Acidobacteriota bacterium]